MTIWYHETSEKRESDSNIVRVNGDEGTPVPIPNTVVKLIYGDNTWLATAREDNSSRTSSKQQLRLLLFVSDCEDNDSCINIFCLIWMGH